MVSEGLQKCVLTYCSSVVAYFWRTQLDTSARIGKWYTMQAFMLIIFEAQFYFTYKFHGDITGRPASGYMKGFVSPVRLQTYLITYSNLFISILHDSLYTID